MMYRISDSIDRWLGLCRRPPVVHVLQASISFPPEPVSEGQPDRSGGSGSIRRGIGSALAGMAILNRNRQLLWFTLLAGLVLAGNTILQGILCYITWTTQPGETGWLGLNFIIELATLFCLVFLMAGLVLSIPSGTARPVSFLAGLEGAKNHLKAIFLWSLVLALAGMLLFSMYQYSTDWFPRNHFFPHIFGSVFGALFNPLMEFPFNPALTSYAFFDPSRDGGGLLSYWLYPSGILQTLVFSEINMLLFVATIFVVPGIVLGKKNLIKAVASSFTMMKKTWGETAACTAFLLTLMAGVFLTYLLVQGASGMAAPDSAVTVHPDTAWIVLALVYNTLLFCIAMVIATVGGIAVKDLYISAKCRQKIPESCEPEGVVI